MFLLNINIQVPLSLFLSVVINSDSVHGRPPSLGLLRLLDQSFYYILFNSLVNCIFDLKCIKVFDSHRITSVSLKYPPSPIKSNSTSFFEKNFPPNFLPIRSSLPLYSLPTSSIHFPVLVDTRIFHKP